MLRLRAAIERATRRRWLGIVVVALLALLVAFVLVHDAEHALEGAAAMCVALVMAGAVVVARAARRIAMPRVRPTLGRAPPASAARLLFHPPQLNPVPLRR